MGCRSSKPDGAIVASSIDGNGAVRRDGGTYQLVEEFRSLVVASGLHPVSRAVAPPPELKEKISKNPGLLAFVNDHLNYVILTTMRSVASVRGQLDRARGISSAVGAALECFDKEKAERRNDKKKKNKKKKAKSTDKYSEVVDKLKESRAVGNPFAGLNADERQEARAQLWLLLDALGRRKDKLEKRLRSVKKRRKAWNMIYTAGFVAVLACSVVLAALASPAAAITTASATAMKAVEPWINSMWDEWEGSLQGEKDVVAKMRGKGWFAVHEFENVRSIVDKLKIDIDAVLDCVDFAIIGQEDGEEKKVKIGMKNIMAKKGDVDKSVDTLKEKLDSLEGEIMRAATEFLELIMKDI